MSDNATPSWQEMNQRYLVSELGVIREILERHIERDPSEPGPDRTAHSDHDVPHQANEHSQAPPALEALCRIFSLSPFERGILLLCAGAELDSRIAGLCSRIQGDPRKACPTFSLALAALPDAHWSALSPASPLRYWRLVDAVPGEMLTTAPLRIDERILHYLAGVNHMDDRLSGTVKPVLSPDDIPPSYRDIVMKLCRLWAGMNHPVVQLCGDDREGIRAIAAEACNQLGTRLYSADIRALPISLGDVDVFTRLWEREAALTGSVLLFEYFEMDSPDEGRRHALESLSGGLHGGLFLAGRERLRPLRRPVVALDVKKPGASEQLALWQSFLGPAIQGANGALDALVAQFDLSPSIIASAGTEVALSARARIAEPEVPGGESIGRLWDACRVQTRPKLDNLARRIESAATWEDLVLPEQQKRTLQEIGIHVRHRLKVYETWGFARKSGRGLGISALFTGASGTGKTMAAEVLANELRLDLYRIDLSQVISKYIGETEKNLRRVFDAAREGGAILLFDEADALFGKRSEVKDSHDRYANIEISYLLQKMEEYRGLAILTTNMKEALDTSFMRRIRFVVPFPFPDAAMRKEIWRHIFPAATPSDGLNLEVLARLNVAGGNIRNIAMNAAFLAAEEDKKVKMSHLLSAARSEYAKLEKPLSAAEIGGWA